MAYDNDIERQRRIADLLRRSKAAREMWPEAQEKDVQADLMGRIGYAGEKIARAFSNQDAKKDDWQYKPYAQAILSGAQKGYKEEIGDIEQEALSDPDSEASDLMRNAVSELGAPEVKQGRMSARQLESMMKPLKQKSDVAASERLGDYRKSMAEAAKDKAAKTKSDAIRSSDSTSPTARALQKLYKQKLQSGGYDVDDEAIDNLPESVVEKLNKDLDSYNQKFKLGEQKYSSAKDLETMRGTTLRDITGTKQSGAMQLEGLKGDLAQQLQKLRDAGALSRVEFQAMLQDALTDKKNKALIDLEKEKQSGRQDLLSGKLEGDIKLQGLKGEQGERLQGQKQEGTMDQLEEKASQAIEIELIRSNRMKDLEKLKQQGILTKANFDAAVKLLDREMQGEQGLKLQDKKQQGVMAQLGEKGAQAKDLENLRGGSREALLNRKQLGDVVIQSMKDKTALEIARMRAKALGVNKPAGMSQVQFDTQTQKLSKALEGHVEAQQNYEHLNKVLSKYGSTLENFDPKTANIPGISLPLIGRVGAGEDFGELKSAVGAILNQKLFDRSGKAVTEKEMEQMKEDFNMGKFNTEEQLVNAARRFKVIEEKLKNNVVAGFSPEVVSTFKSRGGTVPQADKIKPGKKASELSQTERAAYILKANQMIKTGDPVKARKGREVLEKLERAKNKNKK